MSRRPFLLLFGSIALASCGSGPSEDRARGDELLLEGKAEEALVHYQRAVEADPEDVEARFRLARTELALGREREALESLSAALGAAGEGRRDALVRGVQALLDSGRAEAALSWLDREAGEDASDPAILAVRGRAELDLGLIPEAVQSLERAAEASNDAKSLALLGTSYYLAALQELSRASRAPSAEAEAARARSRGYMVKAHAALQDSLYLDPQDAAVHLSLGQLLHQSGRLDEALVEYRWAQRLAPESPDPSLLVGGIHYERGEYEAAVVELERARRLGAPGRAALFLGMTYWMMEKPAESIGAFGDAIDAHPELERQVVAWFGRDRARNVPELIELLGSSDPALAAGSLRFLRGVSGQDLEGDPALWKEWWEAKGRP